MNNAAVEIMDHLFQKYFLESNASAVTSSHWQIVGNHRVRKIDGRFVLKGQGFGSFRENSLFNKFYYAAELFLTKSLVKKYHPDLTILQIAKNLCLESNHLFDYDCLRQVLSLQTIEKNWDLRKFSTTCIIGDGYGFMGSLIKKRWPHMQIISINLGKTQMFDVYYTSKPFKTSEFKLINSEHQKLCRDFNFIEAENFSLLGKQRVDLFINIASMQEMDNKIIKAYFELLEKSLSEKKHFYCCNRTEKLLPDGEITRIDQYPWKNWKIEVDELCPWYQEFPANRPPYWRKFDGPIKHILAII